VEFHQRLQLGRTGASPPAPRSLAEDGEADGLAGTSVWRQQAAHLPAPLREAQQLVDAEALAARRIDVHARASLAGVVVGSASRGGHPTTGGIYETTCNRSKLLHTIL